MGSFSFAKDVIENYKIKMKQTKAKSLREDISSSCQGDQQERQAWNNGHLYMYYASVNNAE